MDKTDWNVWIISMKHFVCFFRRLVEKLENMKKNAMGNGTTQCILCGDEFGLLGASPTHCDDCKNVSTFTVWGEKIPFTVKQAYNEVLA